MKGFAPTLMPKKITANEYWEVAPTPYSRTT
jgi:hypothetical protein